jgi:hypothetical protein
LVCDFKIVPPVEIHNIEREEKEYITRKDFRNRLDESRLGY